jgi:hypothetical protein
VDIGKRDLKQCQVSLYGVLPHEKDSTTIPDRIVITNKDPSGFYLTDYAHAMGYSGGVATMNHVVVGVISARVKGENQGVIIPVSAAGDWLRGFRELQQSFTTLGAYATPDTSSTLTPHDEFANKVRNAIRALMDRPHAQSLRHAITQRTGEETFPPLSASLIEALDHLHVATDSCLQQLAEHEPDKVDAIKKTAGEILGWLVVLAVNREHAHAEGLAFDPWQGGLEVAIPLVSESGSEVFLSSLGERAAWFKVQDDNKGRRRVVGRNAFPVDDLEIGFGDGSNPLTDILRRIWVKVKKTEAPLVFEDKEINTLQAALAGPERRYQYLHYITVPLQRKDAPLANPRLLTSLRETLSSLRVIYFGDESRGELLFLDEYALEEAIEAFLLMLRDTP